MPDPTKRAYLKTVTIHVGIPKLGKGPMHPRAWHAVQRNAIGRMMEAAGFAETGYDFHGKGDGATIVYCTPRNDIAYGHIPKPVQKYLKEITVDLGSVLEKIFGAVGFAVKALTGVLPSGAGPVLAAIGQGADVAEDITDAIGLTD
jgi:hypothetical protein